MGQIVYILQVKLPSRKAKKLYGYGWAWHLRAKFRMRLPDSERDLHQLFLPYIRDDLPCITRIIRNNALHEHKGFKAVLYAHMTHRGLEIIRRARAWHEAASTSVHKVIPMVGGKPLAWTRQPSWAKPVEDLERPRPLPHFRHGPFSNRLKDGK